MITVKAFWVAVHSDIKGSRNTWPSLIYSTCLHTPRQDRVRQIPQKSYNNINLNISIIEEHVFRTIPKRGGSSRGPAGPPITRGRRRGRLIGLAGLGGTRGAGVFFSPAKHTPRGTGLENSHFMISCNKLYVPRRGIDAPTP